jgi:crotonobetainyl-CoA:carnitine CoA-transferase CaiB-like acyl-CoA transferase
MTSRDPATTPPAGILSGIRVVEMATYIFAPVAATVMSDFGAEVIKLEPHTGDAYRQLARTPPMPAAEVNYCWVLDGRNKRSLAVDLKKPQGREVLIKLIERADVLATNYKPSVLARMELTYDHLRARFPRLIYAQATGYGEQGADVDKPGYDMTAYWARSGLMHSAANADGEPCLSLPGMGDHPSAMALFGGIMLALYRREKTGLGTRVTSSLMANGAWANSCLIQAALCGGEPYQKRTRMTATNALVNHYVTRDGKRFILCSLDAARHWPRLCQAIGLPALVDDKRFATPDLRGRHAAELAAIIDRRIREQDMAHWQTALTAHDLIFGPVPSPEEVAADPQMQANDVFIDVDDPRHGPMRLVNSPIFLDDAPKRTPTAAPAIGQHTREVLAELGYGDAQIAELERQGAVARG